jgi:hypothetical protein
MIKSSRAWHIKSNREEAFKESRKELAWRAKKLDKSLLEHYFSEKNARRSQINLNHLLRHILIAQET